MNTQKQYNCNSNMNQNKGYEGDNILMDLV